MEKRKGRCVNIDGCSLADKDVIQEVDEFDDFVCKECGHELEEISQPKKKGLNPKVLMIIIGVVVVGIIIALAFAFGGNKEESKVLPTSESTAMDSVTADSNRPDTLVIKVDEQEEYPDVEGVVEEETVSEDVVDTIMVAEIETPKKTLRNPSKSAAKSHNTYNPSTSHKLNYGSWTGGWRNGQPHGTGTLTYSTTRTIDSRDPRGRVAQPGEYIVGEWDHGHLVQGRWFKNDGTKEAIIIGKAG